MTYPCGHPKNHSLLLASTTAHTFWFGRYFYLIIETKKVRYLRRHSAPTERPRPQEPV